MSIIRLIFLAVTVTCGWANAASAQILSHAAAYFDDDVQGAVTINGLNFVHATAVSLDGKNVYACGGNGGLVSSDNALVVFSRDLSTGELTFVEVEFDDDDSNDPGTADGLFSCRDVTVSPDGKHVYTAGFSDNKVGIFTRDALTGAVAWSAVVEDAVGLDGLAGVEALAMTPDGSALFAVGSIDDALVAFSRNSTTGALTFEDSAKEGLGGVTGLERPIDVAVSPDGLHVYVASGANENFTGSDAIAAFGWNAGLGDLVFVDSYFEGATQGANTIDGLHRVSSVIVSPDGKHAYATGGLDAVDPGKDLDWIAVFSRNSGTGALTWLESLDDFNFCGLDILFEFETYAVVGLAGKRVYITSGRDALAAFERDTTSGRLTLLNASCYFDDLIAGLDTGINLPRKLAIDPVDERHVYIPGNASNAVSAFRVCNPAVDGEDVAVPDQDVTTAKTELACKSLTAADYNVLTGGDAMLIAPKVIVENGFEVSGGDLTVVNP